MKNFFREERERRRVFCGVLSPTTKQLCTMQKGHAGPHQVGGPYHTVETFVIKCVDKPCEYHENHKPLLKTRGIERWLECIVCGHKKDIAKSMSIKTKYKLLSEVAGVWFEVDTFNEKQIAISYASKMAGLYKIEELFIVG